MVDVASTAVFDNVGISASPSNLSISSVNPSIINIIRTQLIHDPDEVVKRNKAIVKSLVLYHRYKSILSRAVHYEKQLKLKTRRREHNATTIASSSGTGKDDLDRRSCVYMVKRHESTGKFG